MSGSESLGGEDFLDLNDEQREAVEHLHGPLLIFAGAGSGKTRVLTRRIVHLIRGAKVSPDQILAVTFTNKAAGEMRERVLRLLGHRLPVWVSTFHSSCARILREHASKLGYSKNFVIYDSDDSQQVLKRVYARLKIDDKTLSWRQAAARIDRAKNEFMFADDLRSSSSNSEGLQEILAEIYAEYQEDLRRSHAMDFGDLLCNVVSLFTLEPKLLAEYQQRFRYLMVDEYQDTNRVQYLMMKMLAAQSRNLCVVGDDDQSIYGFRGASVDNILNFEKDFPEAKVVTLEVNYRSTQNIIRAAGGIIAKNTHRQKKRVRTPNSPGSSLVVYCGEGEREEANYIALSIRELVQSGSLLRDIAIFYRANAQSRTLEEALNSNGIAYTIFGGFRFYDRKEVRDILTFLRLLQNSEDDESFLRTVNCPPRGIGSTTITRLQQLAKTRKCSLFSALGAAMSDPKLVPGGIGKLGKFWSLLEELQDSIRAAEALLAAPPESDLTLPHSLGRRVEALAQLLQDIFVRSGYRDYLRSFESDEGRSREENVEELCRVALEFLRIEFESDSTPSIQDFLDRASLSSAHDKDEKLSATGTVAMMTLHLAKGLEFDSVFIAGMEEGLLPHARTLDDKRAIEEERRLCYVGITRARQRLYLTRTRNRQQTFGQSGSRGAWFGGEPSRFLQDIPPALIVEVNV